MQPILNMLVSCIFQEIVTANYHVGINTDTYLALRSQASVWGAGYEQEGLQGHRG